MVHLVFLRNIHLCPLPRWATAWGWSRKGEGVRRAIDVVLTLIVGATIALGGIAASGAQESDGESILPQCGNGEDIVAVTAFDGLATGGTPRAALQSFLATTYPRMNAEEFRTEERGNTTTMRREGGKAVALSHREGGGETLEAFAACESLTEPEKGP
jgi:hypothetical protein